jgi:oligoendopeptidase F
VSGISPIVRNPTYSAGSSDYPINILKKAGVDMSSPEPINKTIELFNSLVDQFEKLILE